MRIVIGRAESGKTSLILSELAAKAQAGEGRQILLVPSCFRTLMNAAWPRPPATMAAAPPRC